MAERNNGFRTVTVREEFSGPCYLWNRGSLPRPNL